MMNPLPTAATPQHVHQPAILWIDNLVADLQRREQGKAPLALLNHPRMLYWKELRPSLEECKDDTVTRFQHISKDAICPRHWDAILWIHALVIDAMLSTTATAPILAFDAERLGQWETRRAHLLQCRKDQPPVTPEAQACAQIPPVEQLPRGFYYASEPPSCLGGLRGFFDMRRAF